MTWLIHLGARIFLPDRKSDNKQVIDIKYNSGNGGGFHMEFIEGTPNLDWEFKDISLK